MKKNLEDRTLVWKFKPLKDKVGKYIPFCNFGYHQGIVRTPDICEDRHCKHYKRLYIDLN